MPDSDDTGSSREPTPEVRLHTPASSPPPPTPLRPAPINNITKLARSKGPAVLFKDFEQLGGDYFKTFEESFNALSMAHWHPPMNDFTIPRTPKQDRAIVRVLVAAFKDMSYALDTPDNAYRKRFTPGTSVCYAGWTIEACAWMVVRMTKDIHMYGFSAPIYDVELLKAIGQTENWTFQDRIDMICFAIKVSKSVAATLMKHEKVWTTIGAPHKLYNSAHVNYVSNAQRNRWVREGREADKAPERKRQRTNDSSLYYEPFGSAVAGPSSSPSPPSSFSLSPDPFISIAAENANADTMDCAGNMQANINQIIMQDKTQDKAVVSTKDTYEGKGKGKATSTNNPHPYRNDAEAIPPDLSDRMITDPTTFSYDKGFQLSNSKKQVTVNQSAFKFIDVAPSTVKAKSDDTDVADNPVDTFSTTNNNTEMADTRPTRPTADVEAAHALLGFGMAGRVA